MRGLVPGMTMWIGRRLRKKQEFHEGGTHAEIVRSRHLAGQARVFARRRYEKTLAEAGAKLSDLVTMTVFLIDARHTTRMTELRGELFGKDFPASAAITVQGFAQPEMMIEVQGIAVTA